VVLASIVSLKARPVASVVPVLEMMTVYSMVSPGSTKVSPSRSTTSASRLVATMTGASGGMPATGAADGPLPATRPRGGLGADAGPPPAATRRSPAGSWASNARPAASGTQGAAGAAAWTGAAPVAPIRPSGAAGGTPARAVSVTRLTASASAVRVA